MNRLACGPISSRTSNEHVFLVNAIVENVDAFMEIDGLTP